MSPENSASHSKAHEKDIPVLVDNLDTGEINVMRTTGDAYQAMVGDEIIQTEGVRPTAERSFITVASSSLDPEFQENLARELQAEGIPLLGDTVNMIIPEERNEEGKITRKRKIIKAVIDDYTIKDGIRSVNLTGQDGKEIVASSVPIEAVKANVQEHIEAERAVQDKYLDQAEDMINRIPHSNRTQQYYAAQHFLEGLIAAATRGEVTIDGNVAGMSALKDQIYSMSDELLKAKENRKINPFKYIPSVGQMRGAFEKLLADPSADTYSPLMDAIVAMQHADKARAEPKKAVEQPNPGDFKPAEGRVYHSRVPKIHLPK